MVAGNGENTDTGTLERHWLTGFCLFPRKL
jgi:hypothetical protein